MLVAPLTRPLSKQETRAGRDVRKDFAAARRIDTDGDWTFKFWIFHSRS